MEMNRGTSGAPIVAALLAVAVLVPGCATVADHGFSASYEAAYRAKVVFRSHDVPRDGFSIRAREYGRADERPTIVMMHGFPDSMHLYDRLVPLLAPDRHVVTFDFLGWGDSDKPADHRYDAAGLRRDLEAVIAHLDLRRVVLVVHDASGQPGIDWSLDNPDKAAGLVLLNTYYGPSPSLRAPEAIARFSTPGIRRDLSVWLTRHFDSLWLNGYRRQIARFISNEALREPFQRLLGDQSLEIRPAFYGLNRVLLDEIERRRYTATRLGAFKAPVRIVFGNDDPYLNAGVARDLHRLFPGSDLYLLDDAGHFVQIDRPLEVATLLRGFPPSETMPFRQGGRHHAVD